MLCSLDPLVGGVHINMCFKAIKCKILCDMGRTNATLTDWRGDSTISLEGLNQYFWKKKKKKDLL